MTLGIDRPLRQLFGFVRTNCAPRLLTTEELPVSKDGLIRLFLLAAKHGPIPDSCREALTTEVDQFLTGVESHNVVVLHRKDHDTKRRLEQLRVELRAERISYSELAELQSLRPHIAPDDLELLGALGECQ